MVRSLWSNVFELKSTVTHFQCGLWMDEGHFNGSFISLGSCRLTYLTSCDPLITLKQFIKPVHMLVAIQCVHEGGIHSVCA